MIKIFAHIILLVLLSTVVIAQDSLLKKKNKFPQIIEINTGYGMLTKHRSTMDYFITGHVPTLNINVGKIMTGNKKWQQNYGLPEIGVGFYYANFNNKYIGESYSLYGYSKIPFTKRRKTIFGYFDLGMGVSYFTIPFNLESNSFNLVIGSHYNAYLRVGILANIRLSNKLNIVTGLSLNHSSNSKYKTPNLGVNVISLNLGVKYNLYKPEYKNKKKLEECTCGQSYFVTLSGGVKTVSRVAQEQYFASSLVLDYIKDVSYKSGFGAGADIFLDKSMQYHYLADSLEYKSGIDDLQFGLHGAYSLKFNKIWFNLNIGYYLYDKLNLQGKIYSRVAMRAFFYKNIYASIGMKTHFAKADLLEIGVGYYWF